MIKSLDSLTYCEASDSQFLEISFFRSTIKVRCRQTYTITQSLCQNLSTFGSQVSNRPVQLRKECIEVLTIQY